MKVLLVSTVYPPAIGGPAQQTREIALELRDRGHGVTVLTTAEQAETSQELDVVHLPARRLRFDRLLRNARLMRDVDAVMRRVRPDLVHMQSCEGNVPLAVGIVARAHGVPSLIKFSSDFAWTRLNRDRYLDIDYADIHNSSLRARYYTVLQRTILGQYDLIWATSPFQEQALQGAYGLPANLIHSLPNLMQLSRAPQCEVQDGDRPLLALLVARLVPAKGVDIAIRALALLDDCSVQLRIVGEGLPEYVATLQQLARSLGIENKVQFVGAVPPNAIEQQFAAADLFVLPSLYEPFGIVFVQAMAAGLAVVATQVGGVPSIIVDGETGLLVAPGSPALVAAGLRRLAQDPSLRRRLGDAAKAACQRFDLNSRFDDVLAMYRRAIATAAER